MDLLENENFSSSIFRNKNPKFWYKRESWKYAKKIFGWKFDAWHIAKSIMVMLLAGSIVTYTPVLGRLWDFIVLGGLWNLLFGLFYHNIFKYKYKNKNT